MALTPLSTSQHSAATDADRHADTSPARARRAVFLDKDGTLIENLPYNVDPRRIRLAPQAGEALRLLSSLGYALFVVSNQSGVARGLFAESALTQVWATVRELLARESVTLEEIAWCPHHEDGVVPRYALTCCCRKPAPGMLLRLATAHGVDLAHSWMIGDILDDVEAGHRAGCRSVLVDNGNETLWELSPLRAPDHTATTLLEAAHMIRAETAGVTTTGEAAA